MTGWEVLPLVSSELVRAKPLGADHLQSSPVDQGPLRELYAWKQADLTLLLAFLPACAEPSPAGFSVLVTKRHSRRLTLALGFLL